MESTAGTADVAFAALGANLGDRAQNLRRALALLDATPQVRVVKVSSFLENPAVGGPPDSPPFLNAVAQLQTTLPPHRLLERMLEIEQQMGRVRTRRWDPRLIDLDLVLYGSDVIDTPQLKLPHPRLHERPFVLRPLAEIAPDAMHPLLKRTARQLLAELEGD